MKTSGLDVSSLLKKAGINVDELYGMLGPAAGRAGSVPAAVAPKDGGEQAGD